METNILNPRALFQQDVRYTIPPFQRHYVWTQDVQWEPLWEDVRSVAENFLDELDRSGGDAVEAAEKTTPHFLGAVVLQQVPVPVNEIGRREFIDGQQRITTLQLLLDAVQLVCEQRNIRPAANRLARLVLNDRDMAGDEESHVFKLWPTRSDRDAFRHAMDNGLAVRKYKDSLIVQAHDFFRDQVSHWLSSANGEEGRYAFGLETAVTNMLHMVVIDLHQRDDPNVIFETLNARGTPLEQSDLIKNFVLSQPPRDAKWQDVWNDLDDAWWLREVRQGRLLRPRIDMLLNYWLAMRTGDEVSPTRVFSTFQSHAEEKQIDSVMSDVNRDMANYRRFEEGHRPEYENLFYYRVNDVMQMRVITPVLLQLLLAEESVRERAFRAMESFLVRRMICRMTTKDYNRLTLELTTRLRNTGVEHADKVVAGFLKEQDAYSREWPNDRTIASSLGWSPLYRLLTRGRLRLVLEGIESMLRTTMSETSDVPRNLTIEHLIPVSWSKDNWPLPACVDEEEETETRNGLIHTIGNLTLVTGRLNASLSNDPWYKKRATIQKHAVLNLNGELVTRSAWDEASIRARSRHMADLIAKCWPGPDSDVWGV